MNQIMLNFGLIFGIMPSSETIVFTNEISVKLNFYKWLLDAHTPHSSNLEP